MKLRLSILLLAAALAASPAAGQTIKSLGYNTTNGNIVAATNVTFTNSVGFATNARAATRTNLGLPFAALTNTNTTGFNTALGLANLPDDNGFAVSSAQVLWDNAAGGQVGVYVDDGDPIFGPSGASPWRSALGLGLPALTNTNVTNFRTAIGLGATNNVTFSNITASGTLTATGNVTLSGSDNLMPNATNAASASSLMTRDLVGQEFANPRAKIQTTYWFGLEGLGLWQAVSSANILSANRTPKFGPSLAFYSASKPATTASGVGIRLGATTITGAGAWRPVDGGAFTARTQVVNYYSLSGVGNRAFSFSFAAGNNTNFWAAPDSFGLFWVQQPTNSWAASTAFAQHDRIAVSNVVWAVATAGTTDATAPTWTDLIGSTVTNGTAVFRNIGPHTSNNWVLAIGSTNASQVVMTNTGKSNWLRASGGNGHDVLLTLRYGTNTTGPYTVYGSVADGTGQGAEVTLNLSTNTTQVSPQYWLRYDGTNTAVGNEAAGIRYFSIDAELPPLD